MAKAKAKAKAKSKSKAKTQHTLPNGYKVIGRAPNWDPEKNPVLEGERGETQEVTFDKGTKKERTQRLCIVQDDTLGAVTLWESSTLRDFFDQTEKGDHIRVEFLGYGDAKKGQNAPKLFSTGVKE
jgi:hypothetical protein